MDENLLHVLSTKCTEAVMVTVFATLCLHTWNSNDTSSLRYILSTQCSVQCITQKHHCKMTYSIPRFCPDLEENQYPRPAFMGIRLFVDEIGSCTYPAQFLCTPDMTIDTYIHIYIYHFFLSGANHILLRTNSERVKFFLPCVKHRGPG